VFFDIGDTLASPILSGTPPQLTGLEVYPYIPGVLDELTAAGVRLGLISHIGPVTPANVAAVTTVLENSGLARHFPDQLRVYGRKDSTAIFEDAARRAGQGAHPDGCVFTGEDSRERLLALQAGMRVCPHPLLVADVLRGETLQYLRITVPAPAVGTDWATQLLDLRVVPAYIAGPGGREVYAVGTASAAARLDDLGFFVDRLGAGGDPAATELFLFRDDRQRSSGFMNPAGNSVRFLSDSSARILASTAEGLIVAVPGDRQVDDFHFADTQHGHTQKLILDVSLVAPRPAQGFAAPLPESLAPLSPSALAALERIDGALIGDLLRRYTTPGDGTSAGLSSRHILHADNALAVDALVNDLETIGNDRFRVRRLQFTHQGRTLNNVEAELPGMASPEVIIVAAHLDSTATSSGPPYDPASDPAPGADDDASGVAAVLAIATALRHVATADPIKRTIRFVLFNAEEHGLVGSKAYARAEAFRATAIVGVFQMDMVGFCGTAGAPKSFEVHVGFPPSTDVEARSRQLAETLRALAPTLAPGLKAPQIYSEHDPAAGRSDHASFHERGYAACVCSEDFFVGPAADSPEPQPNPNYHKNSDTTVDVDYTADIARLVAGAVLATANA
jgi:hypothetical protein